MNGLREEISLIGLILTNLENDESANRNSDEDAGSLT